MTTRTQQRTTGARAATALAAAAALTTAAPAALAQHRSAGDTPVARGHVFDDANRNGVRDPGESGVRALVSNGRDVIRTGRDGAYEIPAPDNVAIFVIKPRDYDVPLTDRNLPDFYYLHYPDGSGRDLEFGGVEPTGPLPASVDFPLHRISRDELFHRDSQGDRKRKPVRAILFGDPQPYTIDEVNYFQQEIIPDVLAAIEAMPEDERPTFGVTLGDLVGDDLDLFQPLIDATAALGITWWNVLGNHDINFDAETDQRSDETFTAVFGPADYAFFEGDSLFIVLDNVVYEGPTADRPMGPYHAGLNERQLGFLDNLAEVGAQTPGARTPNTFWFTHIPMTEVSPDARERYVHPRPDSAEAAPRAKLLPSAVFSAHWHRHVIRECAWPQLWSFDTRHQPAPAPGTIRTSETYGVAQAHTIAPRRRTARDTYRPDPGTELVRGVRVAPERRWPRSTNVVVGTTSGSWWQGAPNEFGLPHAMMRDGKPNGWALVTFEGRDWSLRYKGAGMTWSDGMHIHAPAELSVANAHNAEIIVNFYTGERSSTVTAEFRNVATGAEYPARAMQTYRGVDPYWQALQRAEESGDPPRGKKLTDLAAETILWRIGLPEGVAPGPHIVTVEATNRFGGTFTERAVIRVVED